jgi:glycosyltransferase involved in cell wall biosynthesis
LKLLVDDIICQISPNRGIHKVWVALLKILEKENVFDELVILSRTGALDDFGDRVVHIPRYDASRPETESIYLSSLALAFEDSVFASTYYTRVFSRPTIALVHDLIPEKLGLQDSTPGWRQRTKAIREADGLLTVSSSTYEDLISFYPELESIAKRGLIGADLEFFNEIPKDAEKRVLEFGLTPGSYVLNVGSRNLYKNGDKLIREWSDFDNNLELVLIGGELPTTSERSVRRLVPDDSDLPSLYAHAAATIVSSSLEGFGLPARESVLMGTPVISLPGVVSEASFGRALEIAEISRDELRRACAAALAQKDSYRSASKELAKSNQSRWRSFVEDLVFVCNEASMGVDSWKSAKKKFDLESECYVLSVAENR